mmetsp:Transcript_73975/g.150194  ORF Transcript_73975/g.150194 Transcript_73975/m.150194 type:complete len:268 (+) Transcript_73975:1285-2088(+)
MLRQLFSGGTRGLRLDKREIALASLLFVDSCHAGVGRVDGLARLAKSCTHEYYTVLPGIDDFAFESVDVHDVQNERVFLDGSVLRVRRSGWCRGRELAHVVVVVPARSPVCLGTVVGCFRNEILVVVVLVVVHVIGIQPDRQAEPRRPASGGIPGPRHLLPEIRERPSTDRVRFFRTGPGSLLLRHDHAVFQERLEGVSDGPRGGYGLALAARFQKGGIADLFAVAIGFPGTPQDALARHNVLGLGKSRYVVAALVSAFQHLQRGFA